MKNKKLLLLISAITILISCNGKVGSQDFGIDESEFNIENTPMQEESQTIDWSDGNSYYYDYTEEITMVDSLQNEQFITVYRMNQPSEASIECVPKVCTWCSTTSYAINYTLEEFPNIDMFRVKEAANGDIDILSYMSSAFQVYGGGALMLSYYDLDNNRIRTEWKINCEYEGPDGFCSERCKYEYDISH